MIKYKGYVGSYEFDEERNLFYGKVTNSNDLITFQGQSIQQVREAFEDAINEYLAWCKKYRSKSIKSHLLPQEKGTGGGGSN